MKGLYKDRVVRQAQFQYRPNLKCISTPKNKPLTIEYAILPNVPILFYFIDSTGTHYA